jgi:predicted RNase H-like HicB family nuclease
MKSEKIVVSVILQDSGEGEVLANVPLLQGCYATGGSEDEAVERVKDVLVQHMRNTFGDHEFPPEEITETVAVKLDDKVFKYTAFFFSMGIGYKVLIPLLPGCVAKGKNFQDALKAIKEELERFASIPSTRPLFLEENVRRIEIEY